MAEEEEGMIGHPLYDDPMLSMKSAQRLGDGGWPGGYLDEDDLENDEDDLDEVSMRPVGEPPTQGAVFTKVPSTMKYTRQALAGGANESSMKISSSILKEIISEGIMLAELGVLDQFELDLDSIAEETLTEAKYKGREVKLGKPMKGDVKKYKVYVKDPKTGNVKKVEFGDPNMEIRRDNPKARKSFRARHGCGTPRASDRTKAAFWSCKMWSKKPVSKILKGK